jgi:hypothetical protein
MVATDSTWYIRTQWSTVSADKPADFLIASGDLFILHLDKIRERRRRQGSFSFRGLCLVFEPVFELLWAEGVNISVTPPLLTIFMLGMSNAKKM